ncbi:MAG: DUF3999 domain-containing protein [Azoarcus sp.]|jgi:hypothetical protein|nr:DUF3999 domain-containing protein [Azoarcus sp.]
MKFVVAWFVAGISLAAPAAENIADYAYRTEIEPKGEATWYCVEIPASVQWQAAHADLRDLRVFDAKGESLPFALTKREAHYTQERREAEARLFPLYADKAVDGVPSKDLVRSSGLRIRRDGSGAVEIEVADARHAKRSGKAAPGMQKVLRGWLLDAGALDFVPDRLFFDWAGKQEGFFRFDIEGSDDLEHWYDWGHGQIVQFHFNGQSIVQREIHLPRRKVRYLRLLWQDAEQAGGVRGARFAGMVTGVESAPFVWSPPIAGEPVPGREGEFIWTFPLSLPLARVSILIDEANTLAPVIFSGRDEPPSPSATAQPKGKPLAAEILRGERRARDVFRSRSHERARESTREENAWRTLVSGVVYRLTASTGEQVEEDLDLPDVPVRQLRLQVDPRGGGLGAEAPVIRLALHARNLTFLARGEAPYQLAVGRAGARPADLPLAALIPVDIEQATASGRLGRAHVAGSVSAPVVRENAPPIVEDDGNAKIVLWAVLFMGVALLAGMAFSLLRSAKKGKNPGEQ